MPDSTRENLLGYLLDALEPHEAQSVEEALTVDLGLRGDLDVLHRSLAPLQADRGFLEPPPGLTARAVRFVTQQTQVRPAAPAPAGPPPAGRWTWLDLSIAAAVCLSAGLLLFPAIGNSRMQADRTACQRNLTQVGIALTAFSERTPEGFFPKVAQSGPFAAGGAYAPLLAESGLLPDESLVICPGDSRWAGAEFTLPRVEELKQTRGPQLAEMQARMGGSYAYTLGHMVGEEYQHTRNLRRARFAALSDAPCADGLRSYHHGGCGQNFWFEDGHVAYLRTCGQEGADDNYFRNSDGAIAPGRGPHDAVLTDQAVFISFQR